MISTNLIGLKDNGHYEFGDAKGHDEHDEHEVHHGPRAHGLEAHVHQVSPPFQANDLCDEEPPKP